VKKGVLDFSPQVPGFSQCAAAERRNPGVDLTVFPTFTLENFGVLEATAELEF